MHEKYFAGNSENGCRDCSPDVGIRKLTRSFPRGRPQRLPASTKEICCRARTFREAVCSRLITRARIRSGHKIRKGGIRESGSVPHNNWTPYRCCTADRDLVCRTFGASVRINASRSGLKTLSRILQLPSKSGREGGMRKDVFSTH